jgi:hypothetical protein
VSILMVVCGFVGLCRGVLPGLKAEHQINQYNLDKIWDGPIAKYCVALWLGAFDRSTQPGVLNRNQ